MKCESEHTGLCASAHARSSAVSDDDVLIKSVRKSVCQSAQRVPGSKDVINKCGYRIDTLCYFPWHCVTFSKSAFSWL